MMDAFQKQCLLHWPAQAKSVLIVENDKRLMQCLARAMEATRLQGDDCRIGVRWFGSN